LQEKDAQILYLLEERARLEVALHAIKSMTNFIHTSPECPALINNNTSSSPSPHHRNTSITTASHGTAPVASANLLMSPDFVASIDRAELALNPDFASPLKTPSDEVVGSSHHIPSSTRQQQFQDRIDTNASAESRHAVFDTELRSRIGLLYDLVDPFRPPSQQSTPPGAIGDDTPESVSFNKCFRQQQEGRDDDVGDDGAIADTQDQQNQQHGSYLPKVKDYPHTFAPEVIDEASLFRILDHNITAKADAFALEECKSTSHTPTINNNNHGGLSAPASIDIDRCESTDHLDCGGWPLGSLSLPTSAREAPHSTEDEDKEGKPVEVDLIEEEVIIVEEAIEEVDVKQKQQKQERHTTMRFTATDVLTSQAVNQLNNGSNFQAEAVAQLLSDGLAMRRSVPAAAFTGINNNKKNSSKKNDKLRHSAPAGLPHSDFRRRSSFLSRPPVARDVLYGLNWLDFNCSY